MCVVAQMICTFHSGQYTRRVPFARFTDVLHARGNRLQNKRAFCVYSSYERRRQL